MATKYEVNIIDTDKVERDLGAGFLDEANDYALDEMIELADNLSLGGYNIYCEGCVTLEQAIKFINSKYISKTFIEDVETQIAEQGYYFDWDIIVIPFEDD